MDFAFAPGTTGQDARLRLMLSARASTTLITATGVDTVQDFLQNLVTSSSKGGDLLGGSHASDEGFLFLPLDSTTTTMPVSYDDLVTVDSNNTIHIPAAVRSPDTKFHFKGCAIGSDDSRPFLTLLKHALDNPQSVTAPKYFHGLYEFTGQGVFEFMGYGFRVMNKTAFPNRTALINAYKATAFTYDLDGTPVPDANWSTWIKRTLVLSPATSHKVQFDFPAKINPAAGGISAISDLPAQCRSRREEYTYALTGVTPPSGGAAQLTFLQTQMSSDPVFQSTHPYPMYQRMHFANFNDFFNGLSWKITVNGTDLNAVGSHYVYTVLIPILKPATTDDLLFNFYPASGSPVMNFKEDNAAFTMFGVA